MHDEYLLMMVHYDSNIPNKSKSKMIWKKKITQNTAKRRGEKWARTHTHKGKRKTRFLINGILMCYISIQKSQHCNNMLQMGKMLCKKKKKKRRQITSTTYLCTEVIFGWNYPNNDVLNFWFSFMIIFFTSLLIYPFTWRRRQERGCGYIISHSFWILKSQSSWFWLNCNQVPDSSIHEVVLVIIIQNEEKIRYWILNTVAIFFIFVNFAGFSLSLHSFHDSVAHFHLPMSRWVVLSCIAEWLHGFVQKDFVRVFLFPFFFCSSSFVSVADFASFLFVQYHLIGNYISLAKWIERNILSKSQS